MGIIMISRLPLIPLITLFYSPLSSWFGLYGTVLSLLHSYIYLFISWALGETLTVEV